MEQEGLREEVSVSVTVMRSEVDFKSLTVKFTAFAMEKFLL